MTDEEILAEIPGAALSTDAVATDRVIERERMLAGIAALRAEVRTYKDPAITLEERQRKLRKAGEAILDLPEAEREIYLGIGRHFLNEADQLQPQIDAARRKGGRPDEQRKVRFVFSCLSFVLSFRALNIKMPSVPGGTLPYSLTCGLQPPRSVICLAKSIWETEGLGFTSLKNWVVLTEKHWDSILNFPIPSPPEESREKFPSGFIG